MKINGFIPNLDQPASRHRAGDYDYKRYLARRTRAGNYFPAFRDFFAAFSTRTAVLLLHLVNVGQARADEDGFIQATPRFIDNGTAIPPDAQDRILSSLVELGVVEVDIRGKTRYVRIDLTRVEELVKEAG